MTAESEFKKWIEEGIADGSLIQRVVCAALRYDDVMICSARHFDHLMHKQINAIGMGRTAEKIYKWEQGFIDQWGQFLTRTEARDIVIKNKQPIRAEKLGDFLYSEDLY